MRTTDDRGFAPIDHARNDGAYYGMVAASWIEIASADDARAIMDDVDPEVLKRYAPAAPLSGEWADGLLISDLAEAYGLDEDDDAEELTEALDAFEDAYYSTFHEALDAAAAAYLAE